MKPVSTVSLEIDGQVYEETSNGDGQYDAFMKAITKIYDKIDKPMPHLTDYIVTIPPGVKPMLSLKRQYMVFINVSSKPGV